MAAARAGLAGAVEEHERLGVDLVGLARHEEALDKALRAAETTAAKRRATRTAELAKAEAAAKKAVDDAEAKGSATVAKLKEKYDAALSVAQEQHGRISTLLDELLVCLAKLKDGLA